MVETVDIIIAGAVVYFINGIYFIIKKSNEGAKGIDLGN